MKRNEKKNLHKVKIHSACAVSAKNLFTSSSNLFCCFLGSIVYCANISKYFPTLITATFFLETCRFQHQNVSFRHTHRLSQVYFYIVYMLIKCEIVTVTVRSKIRPISLAILKASPSWPPPRQKSVSDHKLTLHSDINIFRQVVSLEPVIKKTRQQTYSSNSTRFAPESENAALIIPFPTAKYQAPRL